MIIIVPLFLVVCIVGWVLRPRRDFSKSRKYALFLVILLCVVLALAAVIFQILHNTSGTVEVSNISNTLFIAGLSVIGAAILILAGFIVGHNREIAKGMGFGVCVAIIVSIVELGLLEWLGGV